jgi:DNA repair protein SbcC/Rad50
MIPVRIALKGFLCYRDEQEFHFDGAPLWLLSGLNGSGKSTVFDALAYALFGQHRDGQHDALELIHKDRDSLSVQFEFELDGHRYKAHRTLRRKKDGKPAVTQQLWRRRPDEGRWEEVPDTTRKGDFDAWVHHNIGLNYKTFTSSVLLMQGRSERLIDAPARERFEVLSAIVDLGRFERLSDRADRRRRDRKADKEALDRRLADFPEVADEAMERAGRAVAEAEGKKARAQQEVDRLQSLEAQARRWAALRAEHEEVRLWLARAEGLLAEAAAIERDAGRLAELRAVLPHLEIAADQRNLLARSAAASAAIEAERRALDEDLRRRDDQLQRSHAAWEQLKDTIAVDERREQEVSARLRELAALLQVVALCDRQRQALAELESDLAKRPPDLADRLDRQQAECERLVALGQALPLLARLCEERGELRLARARSQAAAEAEVSARAEAARLEADCAAMASQWEAARKARQEANDEATRLRLARDQAARLCREFDDQAGAASCRACGQPLTCEHIAVERARREAALAASRDQWQQAERARDEAARLEAAVEIRKRDADALLARELKQVESYRRDLDQAEKDARRHARECDRAFGELPEPFRERIGPTPPADWAAAPYPAEPDLDDARRRLRGLDAARAQLQRTRAGLDEWNRLQARAAAVRQTLAEQGRGLPDDVQPLRAESARLTDEDATLKERLQVQRAREKAAPAALDRLRQEREEVRRLAEDKERQLGIEAARREGYQSALARARESLPESWIAPADEATPARLQAWRDELRELHDRGTEARAKELRQAQANRDLQRARLAELERQQAEVPDEARRDPEALKALLAGAREDHDRLVNELVRAHREADRLRDLRDERLRLDAQLRETDRAYRTASTLATLLGRDRLQRHLVRQAERRIVDVSNSILDRLSGGQLRLDFRGEPEGGGRGDEALDLVAFNKAVAPSPIGVAFLSGSQRFRVAVSLALGIGQYASRQHRPIESVIIDEGFGSLDRQGRQVMIQELQNLRSQLRCILLVSHQEEFAEAFPDGYQLELKDGTTVARRVHR